jgi:hypothetical protein
MNKTLIFGALIFSVVAFAGCNRQAAQSTLNTQSANQEAETLQKYADDLDTETKKDVMMEAEDAEKSPLPSGDDIQSLEKDLGGMKLDEETFQ